jgi:Icc-related predicted phosphoesterase
MRICAVSDLHGHLPDIPPCDVLLIGGDICPHFGRPVGGMQDVIGQGNWLTSLFRNWLDSVPAKHVVATWGNHDWIAVRAKQLVPDLRWHMLVDESVTLDGVKFYGTPHQPVFYNWAFNQEEDMLERAWRLIPDDTDVIVFHGPPQGYGDLVPDDIGSPNGGEHTGSPSQLKRIEAIKPKLAVFGHIHSGRGQWNYNGSILANVSIVDEAYKMVHKPMEFEIGILDRQKE